MAGSRQDANLDVTKVNGFRPDEFNIDRGRVQLSAGKREGAKDRFTRAPGTQHRRVAATGINRGASFRPEPLGTAGMVAVSVSDEDGPDLLPVETQKSHLRLEQAGIALGGPSQRRISPLDVSNT